MRNEAFSRHSRRQRPSAFHLKWKCAAIGSSETSHRRPESGEQRAGPSMHSMETARTSQKLIAAVVALSLTLAIVDALAHLGYPAAERALPTVIAASHAVR
jgi:hypothetical protein